jgi:hypothetical protein
VNCLLDGDVAMGLSRRIAKWPCHREVFPV